LKRRKVDAVIKLGALVVDRNFLKFQAAMEVSSERAQLARNTAADVRKHIERSLPIYPSDEGPDFASCISGGKRLR
jgi:hypothetical protein